MPKTGIDRWRILIFSMVMLFASRYCFELPAALKESLEERLLPYMNEDDYEFFYNSFLSIYSLPNLFLPFLNGYFIDKFGHNIMLILCSFLTGLGHIIFAWGLNGSLFRLMIVGRFIFGVGSESLLVSQYSLLTKYFNGQELSLAMTLSTTMCTLGNVVNMLVTPRIAAYSTIDLAVWLGVVLCAGGVVCIILVTIINRRTNISKRHPYGFIKQKSHGSISELDFNGSIFRHFDNIFWSLALTQLFLFSGIISWVHVGSGFLAEKWFSHLTTQQAQIEAGNCLALVWLSAVVSGPFIGNFVDNYGLRPRILILAAIMCTVAMTMFQFILPFIPSFFLGLSYSFGAAAIFPCVAYVVPTEYIGTANGIVISLQNLGSVIFPYIIAGLRVASGDYGIAQVFMMLCAGSAIWFAWLTYKINLKKGYNLELEVDMMDAVGVEVLELRSRNSEYGEYNILNSDERL